MSDTEGVGMERLLEQQRQLNEDRLELLNRLRADTGQAPVSMEDYDVPEQHSYAHDHASAHDDEDADEVAWRVA